MLHSYEIDLKHTVFYQEVFAEGEEPGLEKGREEGFLEGEANVLRRRCGPLEAAQDARVHAVPGNAIDIPAPPH
jgi:predicted transposase YdaD